MLNDLKNMIPNLNQVSVNFEWYDFIVRLITAILLWLVLIAYFKIRRKSKELMIISSIIMYIKSKDILVKGNFINQEDYDNKYLLSEFERARNMIQTNLKDKSRDYINKIMFDFYPDNVKSIIEEKEKDSQT